ncbi:MAG: patatin-like phospholipase family protein [Gammaproteobacteria bacterium]|nr:patatin-like phospholipase family protein [Gammaproteobacteria bacterium]
MKIGLALGSGAARGWSHIGVINALAEMGIEADVVCGTSIGALVGAAYVTGNLQPLEDYTLSLSRMKLARFFEINRSLKGFINKERFHDFLTEFVAADDARIERLNKPFGAVATDLESGREVWKTRGLVLEAVWASVAIPGMFPTVRHKDQWLVDGGLVNPVPVSVCRALGADIVIAVNLNGGLVGKHLLKHRPPEEADETQVIVDNEPDREETTVMERIVDLARGYTASVFTNNRSQDSSPSLYDAIAGSVNIIQDRITRSRMAGDPPDILLSPRLSQIGLLEFYRANETIEAGRASVHRMKDEIIEVLG